MLWSVVAAVNDEQILNSCLLRSPDIELAADIILQKGYASAAEAYNAGIRKSKGEIVLLVHQDVYLPAAWIDHVRRAIGSISARDPNWGVVGVYGVKDDGGHAGYVYDYRTLGEQFEGGIEVAVLDELLLILRHSSGLLFDESLPGFHMYGADICLEARRRGMKSYAVSAFCIHNSPESKMPLEFWKAYLFMRRKWKSQLPIKTTCTEITRFCWPMVQWNIYNAVLLAFGGKKTCVRRERVPDPSLLYQSLLRQISARDAR
jgi:hypothetical protein